MGLPATPPAYRPSPALPPDAPLSPIAPGTQRVDRGQPKQGTVPNMLT